MRFLWALVKVAFTLVGLVAVAAAAAFLTIEYATAARKVEVPPVLGLDVPSATRKVQGTGLQIDFEADEKNVYDETVPANHVVRQEPAAGSLLKEGRRVRVTLSLGPRNFYVPRVVGQPATTAQVKLQEAGLGPGDVVYAPSVLVPENHVVDQEPPRILPGREARVNLLVSSGALPSTYVMPNLIGRPGGRARGFFERNEFRVKVEVEPYEGVPSGTVIRQRPAAGKPLRDGDAVWLWTSRTAAPPRP